MDMLLLFVCGIVLQCISQIQCSEDMSTASIIKQIRKNADINVAPSDVTGETVNVTVGVKILSISDMSDESNVFSLDLYFSKSWKDPRMAFESSRYRIVLTPNLAEKFLWMPDIYFQNVKEVKLQQAMQPAYAADVKKDGTIYLSARLNVLVNCDMDLHKFPFDENVCPIRIESYSHTIHDINMTWSYPGVRVDDDILNGNKVFSILGTNKTSLIEHLVTGPYQRLEFSLRLRRSSAHHVALTFTPSFFLVVLCSLLFWMPMHTLKPRCLVSFLLLLSHVIIMVSCLHTAPKVSYLKAVDIWLLVCFLFLVVGCVQAVALLFLVKSQLPTKPQQFELNNSGGAAVGDSPKAGSRVGCVRPQTLGTVDMAIGILYFFAFIVYNVVFWVSVK